MASGTNRMLTSILQNESESVIADALVNANEKADKKNKKGKKATN